MFAIMTVTGADKVGIIAAVTTTLAQLNVNIHNVSQTIMDGHFTMLLRVEFDENIHPIVNIKEEMHPVEERMEVSIRVQSEAIFNAMTEV
ncbi:ACT domain-containing protein [Corynebacterium incognita]|uniref:UPF0237 protein H0194_00470 n=1 Tax=Corynebacterium incognita TaxID=2754725 RepID=A0A7G7CPS0_9CORY|nr:ACT domain-containing protein [Corynebacterium incognita]QNE89586.1 ACT domain-containing protein [Corynebacterium incognita]